MLRGLMLILLLALIGATVGTAASAGNGRAAMPIASTPYDDNQCDALAAPHLWQASVQRGDLQQSMPLLRPLLSEWGGDVQPIQQRCCKICKKGKACGNSCINRSYTCHQPQGCACNG
jgi:hypothetical protein